MTTASKQATEGQQPDSPQSAAKPKPASSAKSKKPAAPRAQAKPATAKRHSRTLASSSSVNKSSDSDSSRLRDNATRAEALEHENVAVQNKRTPGFNTNPSDVSGVIVPSDSEQAKETSPASSTMTEPVEKQSHKKDKEKHHSKDKKAHLLPMNAEIEQHKDREVSDPHKQLTTLQKKALKSEKKVKKLKKKVHKAEKKDVKPSKIRALKEKLTKAFSKWQRRKKKAEEADNQA